MKAIMKSVLDKGKKQDALEAWLSVEIGEAMSGRAWHDNRSFGAFFDYVRGDAFDPNAIVQHFETRADEREDVDRSTQVSGDTYAGADLSSQGSISTHSSDEQLVGKKYVT